METIKRGTLLTIMIIIGMLMNISFSETLKVSKINSPNIIINGKKACEGMSFNTPSEIKWSNPDQAVKVTYDNGNKMIYFRASQSENNKLMITTKNLSTRDAGLFVSNDTVFILDEAWLYIDTKRNRNAQIRVDLKIDSINKISTYLILDENNRLTIERNIFGDLPPQPTYIDIIGEDSSRIWEYPIYQNLFLYPLIEKIEEIKQP